MDYNTQLEKLRAFLRTDRAILIGCIGMAFLIWLFTKLSQPYQSETSITINYSVPEKRIIAGQAPKEIPVKIEAGGWELMRKYIRGSETSINLALEENKEFQTFSSIQLASLVSRKMQASIKVLSGSVDPISIRMDDKSFKRIPIRIKESITLSPQFQLADTIRISPDSVTVAGPEFVIDKLTHWETQVVDLKKLDKTQNIKLRLKKHQVETVTFDPAEIDCTISVEQYTENSFKVPLVVENAPTDQMFVVIPSDITVKFVVGLSSYESATPNRFYATVDYSKLDLTNPGPIAIKLKESPSDIKNLSYQPRFAEFYINK